MTRPDRIDRKSVQAWVTKAQWRKLRHVVTETERTANDLISEAIDLLAAKYPARTEKARKPRGRSPAA
jgi:hypothetical protein